MPDYLRDIKKTQKLKKNHERCGAGREAQLPFCSFSQSVLLSPLSLPSSASQHGAIRIQTFAEERPRSGRQDSHLRLRLWSDARLFRTFVHLFNISLHSLPVCLRRSQPPHQSSRYARSFPCLHTNNKFSVCGWF